MKYTSALSSIAIGLSLALAASYAMAQGYKPTPPRLARSLSDAQIDKVVADAPHDAQVGLPGWYAKQAQEYRPIATNQLAQAAVPALGAVIADSRKNIPELAGMSDVEVATLYLAQMTKPVEELQALAPTNSMEYLIGAGMRADLVRMQGRKR